MPKFNVALTVRPPIATVIEVEAETNELAHDKAIEVIMTDPHYRILDFDGNTQEMTGDDVVLDGIEEVP